MSSTTGGLANEGKPGRGSNNTEPEPHQFFLDQADIN